MRINNGILSIDVAEHGAELTSIEYEGTEYLWQANPEYWKRHSPVLFPIVGSVWNGEYRSKGTTYKMGQHGFARDMDFTLIEKSDNQIWYALESSPETREKYPYDFRLEIGYQLRDNEVDVMWRVRNTGKGEMAFQIGAHPAFYWPMLSNIERENLGKMEKMLAADNRRGFFRFGSDKKIVLMNTTLGDKGCADTTSEKTRIETDENGLLPLVTETFNHDALILENSQVSEVTLTDQKGLPYLTLRFDAPLVGLWSPPKKNAPFVCIEPWYGRCDSMNYQGDYENKEWIQKLQEGKTFETKYTIVIERH